MPELKCNKCGQPYVLAKRNLHEINIGFEYGSEHDGEAWQFKLCEQCIKEFVADFTVSHIVAKRISFV
jgi:hypothetical protein